MPPDTVQALLDAARTRFSAAGCDSPVLDARLLLQHAAGVSREDLILDPGRVVEAGAVAAFMRMVARRENREPVSRILGEREFYGRRFVVTPDVLDPRPDTETLIDAALKLLRPGARILDLGTGTGAIIITLLAERPGCTGTATDISAAALAVARINAERIGVAGRLQLAEGNWFGAVAGTFDLIVSNPPYIPDRDIAGLAPDVRQFDPGLALAGGADGLDPYRSIALGASGHLAADGMLIVEIGAGQADGVETIFSGAHFRPLSRHADLGGHVRSLAFDRG